MRDYQRNGYEPEALVNFLALLGWHPSSEQEVFTAAELTEAFSLGRVTPSPAKFDLDKLRWFNQQHLRRQGPAAICARVKASVDKAFGYVDQAYLQRVLAVVGDRIVLREDLLSTFAYFFEDPESYDERGVKRRWKADSAELVCAYADLLGVLAPFDTTSLEHALRGLAEDRGVGAGRVIHPVRLATSGTTAGPSLFEMLAALGRARCVRRLRRAAHELGQ